MAQPKIEKIIELLEKNKIVAHNVTNLEKKFLLYNPQKDDFCSKILQNFMNKIEHAITLYENGIANNKVQPLKYGTTKYILTVPEQKQLHYFFKEKLRTKLETLLKGFINLENEVDATIQLYAYNGALSLAGDLYQIHYQPSFIIPRNDSCLSIAYTNRELIARKPQWQVSIQESYTIDKEVINTNQNNFYYIYYVEGAEEYPLKETVIPTIKKKYDQLFEGK